MNHLTLATIEIEMTNLLRVKLQAELLRIVSKIELNNDIKQGGIDPIYDTFGSPFIDRN